MARSGTVIYGNGKEQQCYVECRYGKVKTRHVMRRYGQVVRSIVKFN